MSRIRADRVTNKEGTGAPLFPNGIRVVGLTSLSNVVAGVTTFTSDVSIGGTLTYEDVTNIDSVGLITARSGLKVTAGGIDVTGGNLTVDTNTLHVDATNNQVLIGRTTANTSYPLSVEADGNAENILVIGRPSDDISEIGFFENDTTTRLGELQYRQDHVNFRHRVGDIRFATGGSTERLRIGSAGQIGIAGANYGTSGQVMTSQGASAAPQWATPGGGGLTEIDSWGLYIGNWSAAGGGGWSNARWGNGASGDGTGVLTRQTDGSAQTPDNMPVGTGVTHTNGLFTFPSAGTWEMTACFKLQHKQSQATEFRAAIIPTVDGTSYVPSESNVTVDHSAAGYIYLAPMSIQAVFNFSNTATTNAYVRLNATNEIYINYNSSIIFKKLA